MAGKYIRIKGKLYWQDWFATRTEVDRLAKRLRKTGMSVIIVKADYDDKKKKGYYMRTPAKG